MLKRLTANQRCFRPITFRENSLNLVIASKNGASTKTASRNGLGKSTFVNVIAFCFGLEVDTKRDLPLGELAGWEWTLTFTNGNSEYEVSRGASKPEIVRVKGDLSGCPVTGVQEAVINEGIVTSYKIGEWREVLKWLFFDLSPQQNDTDDGNGVFPGYHVLMSHFVRQNFDDPVCATPEDKRSASELAITYLLGLDWHFLAEAKDVRRMKSEADGLMSVAKVKIDQYHTDRETLRSECDRIEQEIKAAEKALDNFDTVPQAKLVEGSLYEYAVKIAALDRQIVTKSRLLTSARETQHSKVVPTEPMVKFYEEIGLAFSEEAKKKTLDEVRRFHLKLTQNRDSLIEKQIELLELELLSLRKERDAVNARRIELAASINAKAALEDYHRRVNALNIQKEELCKKREGLELHDQGAEIREKAEKRRKELIAAAREALEKLKEKIAEEESLFRGIIERLYAGAIPPENATETTLGIEIRDKKDNFGITYRPQFWGDRSGGKNRLKCFAFDMVILNEQPWIGSNVRFMVHDSVLYDSSDSRQIANALKFVSELCERKGLQYICTINSDDISNDDFSGIFPEDELKKYVIRELDDDPSGANKFLGQNYPVKPEFPQHNPM